MSRFFSFFFGFVADHKRYACGLLLAVYLMTIAFSITPVKATIVPFVPTVPFAPYANPATKEQYDRLIASERKIVDFILGLTLNSYAGYAGNNLSEPIIDQTSLINHFVACGERVADSYFNLVLTPTSALNEVVGSVITSAISYAQNVSGTFDTWFSNTVYSSGNSRNFSIELPLGVFADMRDIVGQQKLYEWQSDSVLLSASDIPFTWTTDSLSGSAQQTWQSHYDNFAGSKVRANMNAYKNVVVNSYFLTSYCYLFVDTSSNTVYFCDSEGTPAPTDYHSWNCLATYDGSVYRPSNYGGAFRVLNFANYGYDLGSLYSAISANPALLFSILNFSSLSLSDFIQGLFYGDSWASRSPWTSVEDLGFDDTYKGVTIDVPNQGVALKASEYFEDILDGETNTQTLDDANVVSLDDGETLVPTDYQSITVNVSLPQSGVSIPSGTLGGITNPNDSYLAYLWHMTQPLVSFTKSLLGIFTFDSIEVGQHGPAWIVFGVVVLGLVSGLIVKFLL